MWSLDVGVDVRDVDVDVLAQHVLDLLLDERDPLAPQVHGRRPHLAVDVVQVTRDGLGHHLHAAEEGIKRFKEGVLVVAVVLLRGLLAHFRTCKIGGCN